MNIPEQALLIDLPPVSDQFLKDLAGIATHRGKPLFRLVHGQKEQIFRNGEWDVKHILHSEHMNCYIKVETTVYRRKNVRTQDYRYYSSMTSAKADDGPNLSKLVEMSTGERIRAIGKPCWIVEAYQPAEEIDFNSWQKLRYDFLPTGQAGLSQKIDLLGEYPSEGRYIWCFDVVGDDGETISPNERTLNECRRRYRNRLSETQTVEQAIQCDENAARRFEERAVEKMNENFMQWAGITANRARGGVVGKPIAHVLEK